ncbi:THAP domain-containing protein 1-like isoform X2 [Zophobas morio]|uniref:THAP domain-containing protein 1-like isoform X2 n=1 Tax=Zophobas morio TaxID=2755281 RepID=UPI0030839DD0
MPTVCAAYNCTYRHKKGDNISLHQFPKDPELKTKWLQAMRRLNYVPSNTARLCSQHFLETDFIIQFGKKLLKNGAVPTVFKFPKHLMKSPAKPRSTRLQKKDAAVSPNISPKSCTIDPELPAEGEQLYVQATPSTSRNLEQSLALTENCGLPSTSSRKRKNFVYFGDCKEDDLRDPKKAKLMWGIAKETIRKQRKTIKYLHTRNRRLQAKVKTLGEIVNHLKNTQRISVDSYMVLQVIHLFYMKFVLTASSATNKNDFIFSLLICV